VAAGSAAAAASAITLVTKDNGRLTSTDRSSAISKKESTILATGREISMVDTTALSPHLGVRVTGVEGVADLLDGAVVSRCLVALKWRGVLLFRGLHLDDEAQLAFSRKLGEVVAQRDQEIFKVSLDPTVNPLGDPAESRLLLDELLEWATAPRFRYTHEWQEGDLVVWDNTGMLHRALRYEASSQRTLHRTTIYGDEAWS
jgi:alpha-ketoglutarate-dependent taurine dioxygenase